jgi:hypothetical protein
VAQNITPQNCMEIENKFKILKLQTYDHCSYVKDMEWRRKQHELACVNFRVVN